ncbi:MAG: hypothetical protein AAB902_00760 [Patescibacteria group bacterium]
MKEHGFFDRVLTSLTGQKHPDAKEREKISIELENLRRSLEDHERNLGIPYQGLERPLGDGGVGDRLRKKIAKKEEELMKLV